MKATYVKGTSVREAHVCETCAQNNEFILPDHLAELMLEQELTAPDSKELPSESPESIDQQSVPDECPRCGISLKQVRTVTRLGCETCYPTFRHYLESVMLVMHHACVHKLDSHPLHVNTVEADLLNQKLQEAIAAEAYEDAAILRDQIQALHLGAKQRQAALQPSSEDHADERPC